MEIPLLDAIDIDILMHRDAHFGGNFDIMLEYYENDGIGIMPDFEIERIRVLQHIEKESQENLKEKILPTSSIESIDKVKTIYKNLRDVYNNPSNDLAILISDLILSEEENPKQEKLALVGKGQECIDLLIKVIDSRDFYDPLYPGYGRAPMHVAEVLAIIGEEKAIPHLFQALGNDNFFVDEALIKAIIKFGAPAKNFVIKKVANKPFTKENDYAAILMTNFPPDEEIAFVALSLLEDPALYTHESLASYLICACEGLKSNESRQKFLALQKKPTLSKDLLNEMQFISRIWNM